MSLDKSDLETLMNLVDELNDISYQRGIRLSNASICWNDSEHADARPLIGKLHWDDALGYSLDVEP